MKELFKQIDNCRKCKTIIGYRKFSIESHGNVTPFAILLSEAPGKYSLFEKQYWIGAGGKILRDCLLFENELEDIFYLTDLIKCWPNENERNRKPKETEIMNCSHFLIREIDNIQPKIIISFGGTSSSFLLNRKVKITREHGNITQYNENTKIITLLHPSGIDRFMDRKLYKKQLTLLFAKIKEKNINNIDEIFQEENERELLYKKNSFTIPSDGNSITQRDVNKNQIRITVDNKDYFPLKSTELIIEYKQDIFEVKFNYKMNRSHIVKLGESLANRINLKVGMKIKMTVLENNKFRIE